MLTTSLTTLARDRLTANVRCLAEANFEAIHCTLQMYCALSSTLLWTFGLCPIETCTLRESSRIVTDRVHRIAHHCFFSFLSRANLSLGLTNRISLHCYFCASELPRQACLSLCIISSSFQCLPVVLLSFHYLLCCMLFGSVPVSRLHLRTSVNHWQT